jgi:hypothetical protein
MRSRERRDPHHDKAGLGHEAQQMRDHAQQTAARRGPVAPGELLTVRRLAPPRVRSCGSACSASHGAGSGCAQSVI